MCPLRPGRTRDVSRAERTGTHKRVPPRNERGGSVQAPAGSPTAPRAPGIDSGGSRGCFLPPGQHSVEHGSPCSFRPEGLGQILPRHPWHVLPGAGNRRTFPDSRAGLQHRRRPGRADCPGQGRATWVRMRSKGAAGAQSAHHGGWPPGSRCFPRARKHPESTATSTRHTPASGPLLARRLDSSARSSGTGA